MTDQHPVRAELVSVRAVPGRQDHPATLGAWHEASEAGHNLLGPRLLLIGDQWPGLLMPDGIARRATLLFNTHMEGYAAQDQQGTPLVSSPLSHGPSHRGRIRRRTVVQPIERERRR
jgi:hypothetical protein